MRFLPVVAVARTEVVDIVSVVLMVEMDVSVKISAVTAVAVCRVSVVLVSGLMTVVTFDCVTEIVRVGFVRVVQAVAVVPPHVVVVVR